MAKRYFNVFRNHVVILVLLVATVFVSEITSGTVASVTKIAAGVMMIYAAIYYAVWLMKRPTTSVKEESA